MLKTPQDDTVGSACPERFMRRPAVELATGLPRATIYQYVQEGRFPKPIKISPRCVMWLESEIQAWMHERIAAARGESA
jgi:prophage regulatory protein